MRRYISGVEVERVVKSRPKTMNRSPRASSSYGPECFRFDLVAFSRHNSRVVR